MRRDRGTIKWNAMMLPEHVERLRQWKAEKSRIERPTLSDEQLAELDQTLQEANEQHAALRLTVYRDEALHTVSGMIRHVDLGKRAFIVRDKHGTDHPILQDDIVHIEMAEKEG